jgi:hypothetical protein
MADIAPKIPPGLVKVIEAGARMNQVVPEGVALGGAVCALYAQHRLSIDVDFVLEDLRDRFDEVRDRLLDYPGWREARIRPPYLILGSVEQVEIGFRQLRRKAPIETQTVSTEKGPLTIPTLEEMLRIKAFLAYERNYVRDFFDFAELAVRLSSESVVQSLLVLDEKMGWENRPSVLLETVKALVQCQPRDLEEQGYASLRLIGPRLKSWEEVKSVCQTVGQLLTDAVIGEQGDAS